MTTQDNARLVRALFDAINQHDSNRLASFLDPNVEWVDVPTGETFHGPDGVKQLAQQWWSTFKDNTVEMTNLVVADDKVAVEYIARGTQSDWLTVGSLGQFPASGRRMEARFCDVYQISNGKVISCHTYYDLTTIMSQLGHLPMTKQMGI